MLSFAVVPAFAEAGPYLLRLALSVSAFYLRMVTADTRGMISFKLVIEDSNDIGYCSSFKCQKSTLVYLNLSFQLTVLSRVLGARKEN